MGGALIIKRQFILWNGTLMNRWTNRDSLVRGCLTKVEGVGWTTCITNARSRDVSQPF